MGVVASYGHSRAAAEAASLNGQRSFVDRQVSELQDALAEYVLVLADSADCTHWAPDRPIFQARLAQAARMFAALRGPQPIEALKTLVASERHGYGWGYLSDDAGQRAEQAFDRFALVVEKSAV